MITTAHNKVNAGHLKRNAYLYVRQSTLHQVFENTESTKRQYALRQHAVAMGWPVERIIVIDSDLGQSGATSVEREGFQRLVAEVGMGKAGIVLGLEVSRLARNSTDWHRLLEICALTETLILDEDGVYDPTHFNDRLLLGLKGTMSEAELHVLRARLIGGILNKARRGELKCPLPVGFVYNTEDQPILDPDKQIQQSIEFFFQAFRRAGSACAVVKAFRQEGLLFPRRLKKGPNKGEVVWAPLPFSRTLQILHNPRYAGAFVYGRSRTRLKADGNYSCRRLPPSEWILIKDLHPGYISWEEYAQNQRRLHENALAVGADRRKSPPREGPALLQGMAVCGVCGNRMTVRYHTRHRRLVPAYVCQREGIEQATKTCQHIIGDQVDRAVSDLVVQSVTPLALEVTLMVQQELQTRLDEVDRLRKKHVERARYEADLAKRRYLHVDPANRLVADSLEADWNEKLRELTEAQQQYEQQRKNDNVIVSEQARAKIAALASDFPRLWHDPNTPDRERKRMLRLLLEDVTLIKNVGITAHVRFKGGIAKTFALPRPLNSWEAKLTSREVIGEIDSLMEHHTDKEIARILNERGIVSGEGKSFNPRMVARLRRAYKLKPRFNRLREKGLLTIEEVSDRLNVAPRLVRIWRNAGLLSAHRVDDKDLWVYDDPGSDPPRKAQGVKLAERQRFRENCSRSAGGAV